MAVNILDEDNLSDDEREDLMSFDPFADGFDGDAENEEAINTEAAESEPEEEPEAEEEYVAAAPAEAEAPKLSERERLLNEQNDLLRGQLQAISNANLAARPPEPVANVQPEDNTPAYQFNVTDDYITAIRDEDPNVVRAALQGIMTGVARATHQALQKEYRDYTADAVANYVNRHQEVTNIQSTVQTDYYGNYPQHNVPAIRQMVVAVGQEVMREKRATSWTPELRNEIARRVNSHLTAGLGGAPSGPVPSSSGAELNMKTGTAVAKKRPGGPKQIRPSSRPAMENGKDIATEIEDMLLG